jgi:hypothetical protein
MFWAVVYVFFPSLREQNGLIDPYYVRIFSIFEPVDQYVPTLVQPLRYRRPLQFNDFIFSYGW